MHLIASEVFTIDLTWSETATAQFRVQKTCLKRKSPPASSCSLIVLCILRSSGFVVFTVCKLIWHLNIHRFRQRKGKEKCDIY